MFDVTHDTARLWWSGAALLAFGGLSWARLRRAPRAKAPPCAVRVLYASQTGQAEAIARRTHARLIAGGIDAGLASLADIDAAALLNARTRSIFIESPANPNNRLTDIGRMKELSLRLTGGRALVIVDNTMAGPVFAQPAKVGADIVLYSATKFIGGHSDVVGGVALANDDALLTAIAQHRSMLGGMPNPYTAWLLTRSLETLKIRAEQQQRNAQTVAAFLAGHPKVRRVCYLGLLAKDDPEYAIYQKQHTGPGSLISFYIHGGEKEAFAFLDHLKIFKLAVSLGSTESLAQHPAAMTHSGLTPADKLLGGVTDDLVRLSIGIENAEDLIWDLQQALAEV